MCEVLLTLLASKRFGTHVFSNAASAAFTDLKFDLVSAALLLYGNWNSSSVFKLFFQETFGVTLTYEGEHEYELVISYKFWRNTQAEQS